MIEHFAFLNGKPVETFSLEQFTQNINLHNVAVTQRSGKKISMNRIGGKIVQSTKHIFKEAAYRLKDELVMVWPVASGRSRDGWGIRANQYDWTVVNYITNPDTGESYVPSLWFGLPLGSPQLPNGAEPILRANAAALKLALARELS